MIFSLFASTLAGLLYAGSFVQQQKDLLSFKASKLSIFLFAGIRLIIYGGIIFYLLHSTMRDSIMVISSFIIGVVLTIGIMSWRNERI